MRVVRVRRFGGPEVLVTEEVADPVAGPGQVVITVAAASVLFVETTIRQGHGGEFFPVQPPYVPGAAVAGRVSSVGDGVSSAWLYRRVVAGMAGGGYAEMAMAQADDVIPVPSGLGLPEAAALFHDGRTALGLLAATTVDASDRVLVTAAAGALGLLLVQRASAAGAQVVAAARGKRKLDLAVEMGAATAVDYTEPDWADRVREATGGAGPTVVFDGAGGQIGEEAFAIIAPGGRFSAHGTPSGAFAPIDQQQAAARGVTVRGITDVQFGAEDGRRLVTRALSEAAAGRLRPVIGQTFPLERAAGAHTAIEAREALGKTLLTI